MLTDKGATSDNFILGNDGSTQDQVLHFGYHNQLFRLGQFSDDLDATGGITTTSVARLWTGKLDTSTGHFIYLNGVQNNSNATKTTLSGTGLATGRIGTAINDTTDGYKGDLAEVIVFNTALSDAQRTNVENYLLAKWTPTITPAVSSPFSVIQSPATQLAYSNNPANATAGATMSAVTVQLLDAYNRVVPGSGTNITLSVASGTGYLQGTLTQATAANGQATFSNLSITNAGTFTLQAAGTGLSSVTSGSFVISPAAAAQLAFVQEPTDNSYGNVFNPPVTVEILDTYGNVRSDNGTNVTLSAGPGTSLFLTGNTAQTGANGAMGTPGAAGIATFDDLIGYGSSQTATIVASAPGLTSATSTSFNFTGVDVDALSFSTQPTNNVAGVTLGEVDVTATVGGSPSTFVPVSLSLASGSGVLLGTLTQTTDGSGVAHFTDLSLTNAGTFSLQAVSSSVTNVSASFTIAPAAVAKVVFTVQPTNTTAGSNITIVLQLVDIYNNSESQSGSNVTVALNGGTLASGTTTQATDANGQATFNNLVINTAGTGLNFSASSAGLTGATSASFNVNNAGAAQLGIVTQPSSTATAGVALAQQPVVVVQDIYGNAVSNSTALVTASLSSGNLNGGTNQVAANGTNGRASFSGLIITNSGVNSITFSASGLTSVISSSITVSAGSFVQLGWTTQPGLATNTTVFGQQPVLKTLDTYGNPTTSGLSATQMVSVLLSSGTGPLVGTTVYNIGTSGSNGMVAFSNLQINSGGAKQLSAVPNATAPANISGLQAWYDASDLTTITVTSNGTNVSSWSDKSGAGHGAGQGTTTQQPWVATNSALTGTIGSGRTLHFAGNDFLGTTFAYLAGSSYTIFAVDVISSSFGGVNYILGNENANAQAPFSNDADHYLQFGYPTTNSFRLGQWNDDLDYTAGGAFSSVARTWEGKLDTSVGHMIYLNGSQVATNNSKTALSNTSPSQLGFGHIGCAYNTINTSFYKGDIAEILIYNRALSDGERATVESYLNNKWVSTTLSNAVTATFTVQPAASAVSVSANSAISDPGTNVTYTASVAGVVATNTATGTIQFRTNGVALGGPVSMAGAAASLITNGLAHGTNVITAEYSGDVNFNASTNTLAHVTDAAPVAAANFNAGINVNNSLSLDTGKLLALANDTDGDSLSIPGVTATSTNGGSVSLVGSTLTYTPVANYTGSDLITYALNDGFQSVSGFVYVTITDNTGTTNLLSSVLNGNGSVTLNYAGIPNYTYHVQVASNLAAVPVLWMDLTDSTNTASTNGNWTYTDSHTADFSPRFYRTVSP